MARIHGSISKAGKVKAQTPKVEICAKLKPTTGRAKKRQSFNKRFGIALVPNRKLGPNAQKAATA